MHSSLDGPTNDGDRNMSDSIKLLSNRVKNLEMNLTTLSSQLSEERSARGTLQTILKNYVSFTSKDFDSVEWPTMESNILN